MFSKRIGKMFSFQLRYGEDNALIERLAKLERQNLSCNRSELLRNLLRLGIETLDALKMTAPPVPKKPVL